MYSKDEMVRSIIKHIEENSKKFNDFKTKNDIAIFYKIDLVQNFPDLDLYVYLESFNKTTLSNDIRPTFNEMRNWSAEMVSLCENAIGKIEEFHKINKIDQDIPANHALRLYRNHKIKTDTTNYSGWRYIGMDIKYSDLKTYFLNLKEKHEKIFEMV